MSCEHVPAAALGPGYFLGVGSNAEPRRNIPLALEALVRRFGALHASAVHLTQPVAVAGEELFRNLVLFLPTALTAAELKAFCNGVEERLGRDRSDPRRKWIARPVDLDILYYLEAGAAPPPAAAIADEPYFRVAIPGLLSQLGLAAPPAAGGDTEAVRLGPLAVGERPFGLRLSAAGEIECVASGCGETGESHES